MDRSGPAPRVLLAEPHELYRLAFADVLSGPDHGSWLTDGPLIGEDLVTAVRRLDASLVVLCVQGPGDLSVLRKIATDLPEVPVMAVSAREDGASVLEALRAGARAFLPKSISAPRLLDAVARVFDGETVVDPALAGTGVIWAAQQRDAADASDPLGALTAREREVVTLLADGLGAAAIAARLVVSPRTVEGHLAKAYRKLGAHNAIEAIRSVMRARESV
jgi:two-component system, NarL family, response regulator DesR